MGGWYLYSLEAGRNFPAERSLKGSYPVAKEGGELWAYSTQTGISPGFLRSRGGRDQFPVLGSSVPIGHWLVHKSWRIDWQRCQVACWIQLKTWQRIGVYSLRPQRGGCRVVAFSLTVNNMVRAILKTLFTTVRTAVMPSELGSPVTTFREMCDQGWHRMDRGHSKLEGDHWKVLHWAQEFNQNIFCHSQSPEALFHPEMVLVISQVTDKWTIRIAGPGSVRFWKTAGVFVRPHPGSSSTPRT